MKSFALLLAISLAGPAVFASVNRYEAQPADPQQYSLEFVTGSPVDLDAETATARLHTFASKAEPEHWVLLELGSKNPEDACSEIFDIQLSGWDLIVTEVMPAASSSNPEFELFDVKYRFRPSPGEVFHVGMKKVRFSLNSETCQSQVEAF